MKILHYALGFPPYRSGGLTTFSIDIMKKENEMGHEVALLWPGQMMLLSKKVMVKDRGYNQGIRSFELTNPLPISYDEGIVDADRFTSACDERYLRMFLKSYKPEVIHVHTLMGLRREFLQVAKKLKIKLVFSVHDFFPVCPKVTLYKNGSVCESAVQCEECPECNLTALSMKKIFLLQSPLYRALKEGTLVKKLRKSHRDRYLSGESAQQVAEKTTLVKHNSAYYRSLRKYYESMVLMFDVVHYNSSVTQSVFERFFQPSDSRIISITHKHIEDNRTKREFGSKLRITYLGPQGEAKGYYLLKGALDQMWKTNKNFSLNVFFEPIEKEAYMHARGRYNYSDLKNIFAHTDVVVAPSLLYETFGYTVLEALSFGVPVVISGNVGAKDILPEGGGIVLEDITEDKLKHALESLNPQVLQKMNQSILEEAQIMSLERMTEAIIDQCYR